MDPNYAVQMDAYRMTVAAQQQVEVAKANAEEARYQAMGAIAQNADSGTRGMALVALALAGKSANGGQVNINLPQAPESQQDKAYKWAALFAAPAATLIQGYFGYRTATNASDNNRETSIASYNAFGTIATAGFRSNASIANSGFNASTRLGSSALGAFATRPPSITMSIGGDGVIGNGSFAGPNSGTNSGNSGRISSPDDDHRTVTCTPTVDVPC
jgi:hypothetical protein